MKYQPNRKIIKTKLFTKKIIFLVDKKEVLLQIIRECKHTTLFRTNYCDKLLYVGNNGEISYCIPNTKTRKIKFSLEKVQKIDGC